jgi:hypothetical protein
MAVEKAVPYLSFVDQHPVGGSHLAGGEGGRGGNRPCRRDQQQSRDEDRGVVVGTSLQVHDQFQNTEDAQLGAPHIMALIQGMVKQTVDEELQKQQGFLLQRILMMEQPKGDEEALCSNWLLHLNGAVSNLQGQVESNRQYLLRQTEYMGGFQNHVDGSMTNLVGQLNFDREYFVQRIATLEAVISNLRRENQYHMQYITDLTIRMEEIEDEDFIMGESDGEDESFFYDDDDDHILDDDWSLESGLLPQPYDVPDVPAALELRHICRDLYMEFIFI